MNSNELPTFEYVNECLSYDPDTGVLRWKERPLAHFKTLRTCRMCNTRFANTTAGSLNNTMGYIYVGLAGKNYYAHRLAWLLHTGTWPANEIDHIDGNRSNNTMKNLREATHQQNCCNTPRRLDNTSSIRGVSWHKQHNKWQAQITFDSVNKFLGCFDNINDAKNAYITASEKYHGEFART